MLRAVWAAPGESNSVRERRASEGEPELSDSRGQGREAQHRLQASRIPLLVEAIVPGDKYK